MKLSTVMKAAKEVPLGRVWEKAKEVHKICGKPTATLFVDMLGCAKKYGAGPTDPEENRLPRHSSAIEAANVAKEAGVKKLLLCHTCSERHEAAVQRAQSMLDIPVEWATPFKEYCF